jgi:hypothetical protein
MLYSYQPCTRAPIHPNPAGIVILWFLDRLWVCAFRGVAWQFLFSVEQENDFSSFTNDSRVTGGGVCICWALHHLSNLLHLHFSEGIACLHGGHQHPSITEVMAAKEM